MYEINVQRIRYFIKLLPYIKKDIALFIGLFVFKAVFMFTDLISPFFYYMFVNDVLTKHNISKLVFVFIGYIGLFVTKTFAIIINKKFANKIFIKLSVKIKAKLLTILMKIKRENYNKFSSGDLVNRLDKDILVVEKFFSVHIIDYLYSSLSMLVIIILLLKINIILAMISFVMVPLSFLFVRFMSKKAKKANEKHREMLGIYESFLHNTFQGWKEVKLYNLEEDKKYELEQFREKLAKLVFSSQIYWFINRAFIAFKDFFITKMNLYFVGGLLIITGRLDVALLLVFMNYYELMFSNLNNLTDSIIGLQSESPSIERIFEIMDIELESKPYIRDLDSHIIIKDINFKYYEEQDLVLKNVNIDIAENDQVAFGGRSGSGKTTLAMLIKGMYEPVSGSIFIGQHDISNIAFESISKKIAIVVQEPQFLNLTIEENLRLVKRRASKEEIIEICKKVNAYEFIENLPEKFNTVIGEKGIKLSGGQRQRLAVARLLLQNPDIIILDEVTSSLDSENEKVIVTLIQSLSKSKTIISIAHRLSTILAYKRIFILEKGEIVAEGKHEDLRGNNEYYKNMFESQYICLEKY